MRATVLGATGFVGGAVVRELARRGAAVRAVGRRVADGARAEGVEWVRADLLDPSSLRGVCEDSDVLLQLASALGPDEELCRAVNERGTAAAVAEARRAGVGHVVLLSTTAVYGAGPHRGAAAGSLDERPVSGASRTRLAAERPVLEAGGTVLRAGLVLGEGDRWVVPAMADLLRRAPARWDHGRGLRSMVDVGDLARLIAGVAALGSGLGVRHAFHPEPVSTGRFTDALDRAGILPGPVDGWPLDRCLDALRSTPGPTSERQFRLLAEDHWYLSGPVWAESSVPPGAGPLAGLARAASWYRAHLAENGP